MTADEGTVHDRAVLQSLLSVLSDGVLATDVNGMRLYSNSALDHIVGQDACEPRRSSAPPAFLPTESLERYLGFVDMMRRGTMQGDCVVLDFAIIDAEGEIIEIPMHLVPVVGTQESVVGMLWVFLAHENADLRRAHRLEKAMKSIASELEELGYASLDETERDVPGLNELSRREAEVLELLLSGHRVANMAESLFVSTHTVRNHLKAIFKKTGVHSQADLIRLAKGPKEMNTSGNGDRS